MLLHSLAERRGGGMAKPMSVVLAQAATAMRCWLRRLVAAVAAGSADANAFDEAGEVLTKLRDALKDRARDSDGRESKRNTEPTVPEHFLCPISSVIMRDLVVLASGQVKEVKNNRDASRSPTGSHSPQKPRKPVKPSF